MSMKMIAPVLLSAVLLTGCLGSSNPAGTTTGTNSTTNTPTGGNTGANPGTSTGAAQAFFATGRSWDYTMATTTAGQTMNGSFKIAVSEVKDGKATITTTVTMPPAAATTNTSTVDVNDQSAFNSQTKVAGSTPKSTTKESVTVPAGAFDATKYVYEQDDANATTTVESWIVDGVGMVKQHQTTKPKADSMPNIPNIPGMPAGGLDLSVVVKIELQKFTK